MMPSVHQDFKEINHLSVKEVPTGSNAELECNSNNHNNNFMFWLFDNNKVVGPTNEYDDKKYKYQVLSGRLHIKNVSPEEAGLYRCVSKRVNGSGIDIAGIQMVVKDSFTSGDAIKLVTVIASIIVIIICAVMYYKLRKEWRKYEGCKIVPVDEVNDEDGDEVYNRTTTLVTEPVPGPSKTTSDILLYGIDNQGLDTDFNSVFENIQIKRIH